MSSDSTCRPSCGTLVDRLRRQAGRAGDDRGFHFLVDGEDEEQFLGFADLDRRSRSLAADLQRLGLATRGDRAILLFPPGLEFLPGLFGCLAAGLIGVPVQSQRPNRPGPQLGSIVENSGATLLLTTAKHLAMRAQYEAHTPQLSRLRWH